MTQKKYLIVGSGLSGITLSIQLIQSGHTVALFNSGINRSSKIAAGLINPIVFRRMAKSWRVDDFLPYAKQFYTNLEKTCNTRFFFPITIRRMFSSEQERSFWLEKEKLPEYTNYLFPLTNDDSNFQQAINDYGSGRVNNAAYVNTEIFLEESLKWIAKNANLIHEVLDYSEINPVDLIFKDIKYDGIVFCEGADVQNNPWFGELPINPTKGETLTIHSDKIIESESLNRKCFILPLGNKEFKIGSTYVWNTYDDSTTESGKQEILSNLSYLTNEKVEVIEHCAGIRPTTMDRRPVMGSHPQYPDLHIFNGLGAKGYLIAPLLAKEMVDYLMGMKELDKEVKNTRYYK